MITMGGYDLPPGEKLVTIALSMGHGSNAQTRGHNRLRQYRRHPFLQGWSSGEALGTLVEKAAHTVKNRDSNLLMKGK